MDYHLVAVGIDTIDMLAFGHWVPLSEAIETIKDVHPEALGIINYATQAVVWSK